MNAVQRTVRTTVSSALHAVLQRQNFSCNECKSNIVNYKSASKTEEEGAEEKGMETDNDNDTDTDNAVLLKEQFESDLFH